MLRRKVVPVLAAVAVVLLISAPPPPAWADPINKDQLKLGMPLSDTLQAFGQPSEVEWVNLKGQAVLFLFYEGQTCTVCLELFTGQDVIQRQDGRLLYPLGFIVDALSGWGRSYYESIKLPKE